MMQNLIKNKIVLQILTLFFSMHIKTSRFDAAKFQFYEELKHSWNCVSPFSFHQAFCEKLNFGGKASQIEGFCFIQIGYDLACMHKEMMLKAISSK